MPVTFEDRVRRFVRYVLLAFLAAIIIAYMVIHKTGGTLCDHIPDANGCPSPSPAVTR